MKVLDQEILLAGIVGSTAYGLNGPRSDVDRLGIFAAPTSAFHGLHMPKETHVQTDPTDITIHEAAKWCRLAMGCNPTAIELVWLPQQFIELMNDWGAELRDIRACFPTATGVRNAYLGYASQQLKRLRDRGGKNFSSDTQHRTAKHARHLFRLCHQGLAFYETGRLPIRLEPEMVRTVRAFGARVEAGDIAAAEEMIKGYEQKFDRAKSPLSDRPDEERIERWLRAVRHAYWKGESDVQELQRQRAALHAELLTRGTGARRGAHLRGNVPQGRS